MKSGVDGGKSIQNSAAAKQLESRFNSSNVHQ